MISLDIIVTRCSATMNSCHEGSRPWALYFVRQSDDRSTAQLACTVGLNETVCTVFTDVRLARPPRSCRTRPLPPEPVPFRSQRAEPE